MSPFAFRPYEAQDFEFCNSLVEENMQEYMRRLNIVWLPSRFQKELEKGGATICWVKEKRAGFFHVEDKEAHGYINHMQVAAAFRNQGLGQAMLKRIEKIISERGYTCIRLSVFKDNPARRLYQRSGYQEVEEKEDKYLMEKVLKDQSN